MKKVYLFISLSFLFFGINAQTNFYFIGTGANADGAAYNATTLGYEKANIGTYFRATTGGTVTDGSATCDGYTPSKATSSSIFYFVATANMTSMTVRGTGTGTNRTFSAMATASTLAGTYTAVGTSSATGAIGTPSSSNCGAIVITFGTTITAGTYMRFTFSGNVNVTSLILNTVPTISTSTNALGGFTQVGATPSASQNYTVSGYAISATTVDLNAPASYQISTDNSTWVTTINLPAASGIITGQPKTIYARLNDPVSGAHTGNITHASTSATNVNVALSGSTVNTPTISVSPSSLSFGNVFVGTTTSEQSYSVSAVLLTPSSGNIAISVPAGYEISTTSGSGFVTTLNLAYSSGSLSGTTIFVRLTASSTGPFNGTIDHTGGGASLTSVTVTGTGVQQQVGDYGSITSGNWGTAGTWQKWDGAGFNTVAATAPTSGDNVWINAPHTVTVEAGGKACKNLIVNGTLKSSTLVNTLQYIQLYGSALQVNTGGLIGDVANLTGDNATGLGVDIFSNNVLIYGSGGGIYLSRLRTNNANSITTIDHDMTLNYHGGTNQGGHTIAFYPAAGDNSTLNINAGKTLTFSPWACLGTTSSSNSNGSFSFTLNVNGTLNIESSPAPNAGIVNSPLNMIYGGVAAGKLFTLNVGTTGVVNIPEFYPNGTGASGAQGTGTDAVINVTGSGQLNVSSVADFRRSTQTVTGTGQFALLGAGKLRIGNANGITSSGLTGTIQTTTRSFSTTGSYLFEGSAAQVTGNGLPSTVGAITINNTSNVTLTSPTAAGTLTFTSGKLILGANNITANTISGATSANYVITNGAGTLGLNIPAATGSYTFPIGSDATNYRPANINFTVAPSAGTLAARCISGFPGNTGLPLTELAVLPSITDNISLVSDDYWEVNQVSGSGGTYDATFTGNGQTNILNFANTTLIKRTNALGNWAIDGTHVATTGSNTAPVISRTGLTGFSQFAIGGPIGALPVTLISFNGSLQNNQVKLFWKTENEINVRQYVIEKSTDARTYNNIGTVAALNGITNNYNYTDATSLAGVAYYRLKIIDRDGSFKYSNIIAVNNKKPGVLSIFPNPVNSSIFITHDKALAGAKIEVYAMDGRKVMGATATTGATQTSVNAASLPAGHYNLVFANGDNVQFIKFVKQ